MKSFYLLSNPELFQGENKIKKESPYFEGWYFKNIGDEISISFIPGVHIENGIKSAFIQIITNSFSCYIPYSFSDFHFTYEPFSISIGNNFFSLNEIKIDIEYENISIHSNLHYRNHTKLKKDILNPNIMGAFSFIPFMECKHAILSMNHEINGTLTINNKLYHFNSGTGYIEKDWGTSFPSSYVWAQANNFKRHNSSFFLSIATIPLFSFSFTGFICAFVLGEKEYRFATYTGAKIIKYEISSKNIDIVLRDKNYTLYIYSYIKNKFSLKAPRCGSMKKEIYETIDTNINLSLSDNKNILFEDESINCGLEIVL